jgi:hypothetical protein
MALNPSGAISLGGPVAGQSIALELGLSPTAVITLNDTAVRTLAGVPSGAIIMPTNFWGKSNGGPTQKALFGWGFDAPLFFQIINYVSNTGVMASDTPTTSNARTGAAGSKYGGDKGIVAGGNTATSMNTNLITNTGVIGADTTTLSPNKRDWAAASYGGDKAIFAYGFTPIPTPAPGSPGANSQVNTLVSNTGVMASYTTNTPGATPNRSALGAASYGGDKAIFAYGRTSPTTSSAVATVNLVSNTGVLAASTTAPGVTKDKLGAASYGGDKAIFAFGASPLPTSVNNFKSLVTNTGVISAATPSVGTARFDLGAATYGADKAIFGFGIISTSEFNMTNLVSNTGVVASDTPGVGTARSKLTALSYSFT